MAWLTGYPRNQIDWFPTINPENCVQCGMCMNCGKKVFDWTEKGAIVSRPYECVVGCTTCATLCQGEAITFPNAEYIRKIYQKEHIWSKVKKQLLDEGKIWLFK